MERLTGTDEGIDKPYKGFVEKDYLHDGTQVFIGRILRNKLDTTLAELKGENNES